MSSDSDAQASFGIDDLLDADPWTWSATHGNRIAPGLWPEGVPDMDYSDPTGPVPVQE